jgi:hypothetical protein
LTVRRRGYAPGTATARDAGKLTPTRRLEDPMGKHDDAPRDGFVSGEPPADDEIDLSAPEGTPEYERAQEEVMIRGATDAETDVGGGTVPGDERAEQNAEQSAKQK